MRDHAALESIFWGVRIKTAKKNRSVVFDGSSKLHGTVLVITRIGHQYYTVKSHLLHGLKQGLMNYTYWSQLLHIKVI
ncbi:hypothetical protein A3715_14090 [Oleiphilus sp. HI0009]|nr:hypothetical protein A3715_14090 [Oleiphilus sp. HI0009]